MKSLSRIQIGLYMVLLSFPTILLAQNTGGRPIIENPLGKTNDLFAYINSIIDAALKLGAIVAVIAIIIAGFMFVTAQGDEKKLETAKRILLYAAIGMVILLGARAISAVIINTVTNVDNASR